MAWARFPDGTRRKVEQVSRADAQADLDRLLADLVHAGQAHLALGRRRDAAPIARQLADEVATSACSARPAIAYEASTIRERPRVRPVRAGSSRVPQG